MINRLVTILIATLVGLGIKYELQSAAEQDSVRREVQEIHESVDAILGIGNYNHRLDSGERDWMYMQMLKIKLAGERKPVTPENLSNRNFVPDLGDYWNFRNFLRTHRIPQMI